jgi:NAD(P)-dependent dehydrogenase (short-subunit alcohol dehydrogenase family)
VTAEDYRVVMVTGGSGTIGRAIARQIAALPGYAVVLACRDEGRAKAAAQEIVAATGNRRVRAELVDVSRKASVQALAARWRGPLHVLVNNAAITPKRRQETPEGIELQFATNVLGYFWMMEAFAPILKECAPARIVNVASAWSGELDPADLEFTRRSYSNQEAYRQSKQANRMLTVAFAERLKPLGITVNACHPAEVGSPLSRNLGFALSQSPDEGARTPVWLATSAVVGQETGKYFERMRPVRCRFGEDREAMMALLAACQRY